MKHTVLASALMLAFFAGVGSLAYSQPADDEPQNNEPTESAVRMIAVMPFEVRGEAHADLGMELAEEISGRDAGDFQIEFVAWDRMKATLGSHATKAEPTAGMLAKLASSVDANAVVFGSLAKFDGRYVFRVKVFSAESGTVVASTSNLMMDFEHLYRACSELTIGALEMAGIAQWRDGGTEDGGTEAGPAPVRDYLELAPGRTEGELTVDEIGSDGFACDYFFFEGTEGQEIRLFMGSNDFDSFLLLELPDGRTVANDDSGGDFNALLEGGLPATGRYVVACRSANEKETGHYVLEFSIGDSEPDVPALPNWVTDVPSEPGVAIFGVGSGMFRSPTQMQRALREADAQARRAVAETLAAHVTTAARSYTREVVGPDGQVNEERVVEEVTRSVFNMSIGGVEIVERFITPVPDENGLVTVYALGRLDLVGAIKTMQDALAELGIDAGGEENFDKLRNLLRGAMGGDVPDENRAEPEKPALPEWVRQTPSAPGHAIYGVGSAAYKLDTQMRRAMREANAQARRNMAEMMGLKIEAMIKSYAAQLATPDGEVSAEVLVQDMMRAFVERGVQGAEIVRTFVTKEPDENGLFDIYALAEVRFDAVAEAMQNAAVNSRAVANVRERAERAFADIDKKLADVQRDAFGEHPLRDPIDGETGGSR